MKILVRPKKYVSNFMDGYLTILRSLSVPCPPCQPRVHTVSPVSTLSVPCPHCQSSVHPANPLPTLSVQWPPCQSNIHTVSPVSTLSVQCPRGQSSVRTVSPVSTLPVQCPRCQSRVHTVSATFTLSPPAVFKHLQQFFRIYKNCVSINGCHDIVPVSPVKTLLAVCPFVAGNSTLHLILVVQRVIYQGSSWEIPNGLALYRYIYRTTFSWLLSVQFNTHFRLRLYFDYATGWTERSGFDFPLRLLSARNCRGRPWSPPASCSMG